jgi:hypothetical protein
MPGVESTLSMRVMIGLALLAATSQSGFSETGQRGLEAIAPVSAAFCEDMRRHHVLSANPKVGCDRLRLVKFSYLSFDGRIRDDGEIVVMDAAAPHVLRIFESLRKIRFPIHKARPMNEFDGNDDASTAANNTSAFNDRNVSGGSAPSLHAYGLAIDLNPVQNPYLVVSGTTLRVDPPAGTEYLNRMNERPGKPPRPGMAEAVVRLFADEGFLVWGGYWDNPVDYQHFQVSRKLAERLASLPPAQAATEFDRLIERFRDCQRKYPANAPPNPHCVIQAEPGAE